MQPVVDVHAHHTPAAYAALMREIGGSEADLSMVRLAPSPAADLEARFGAMERAGVDLQVLSPSTLHPYLSDRAAAVRAARLTNDACAQLVRAHPRRLAAFAALPLPHVEAALGELARAFDELGMLGVAIVTTIAGRSPADPAFDPIWQELDRRGGALFIHPAGFACGAEAIVAGPRRMPLGGTLEDTQCVLDLMERGFHALFPRVGVVFAHLGGTFPFLLHRFERMAARWPAERERPSAAARRYWYDTVNGHPAALRCACETVGADRLVLGTDYPYFSGDAHVRATQYVRESKLPAATVEGILRGNAARLFPRLALPV